MREHTSGDELDLLIEGVQKEARRLTSAMERAHGVLHDEQRRAHEESALRRREALVTVMGLGVLVNDVQNCRNQLRDLSSRLPGLNAIDPDRQEQVALLGRLLFGLVEDTREVEHRAWDLAEERLRRLLREGEAHELPKLMSQTSPLALGEGH